MKIGNLGKSALVGLGLSCGVGATPLIRMSRASNETSLLHEKNFARENFRLSALEKRSVSLEEYNECVGVRVQDFNKFMNETKYLGLSEIYGNTHVNDPIDPDVIYRGDLVDLHHNEAYTIYDKRYSEALSKYKSINEMSWNIESCLRENLSVYLYNYHSDKDSICAHSRYYQSGYDEISDPMAHVSDDGSCKLEHSCESGCSDDFMLPFSVPVLPGVPAVSTMYSKARELFKQYGKSIYLKISNEEFLETCLKPEIETYCKNKDEGFSTKKHSMLPIVLGLGGAVSATTATIASILYYRHRKAVKANQENNHDEDVVINVRTSVEPNQDNNTAREIDIVESHTNLEDNVINNQKNTNQKGLHSTKSIIKDDMQTAPPSYEEVIGCSNSLEDVEEDIADIINYYEGHKKA